MVPPETPPERPRCKARSSKTGNPCKRPPMIGQAVCGTHGGKAPQNIAAAERRMAEIRALEAVENFGLSREIDAKDALLEELYRTAGAVDWLHAQVLALPKEDIPWGVTQEEHVGSGEWKGKNTTKAAAVNIWVQLWQEERKHLVAVSKAAISAGIEERRVKLAEQQGALLAGVIKAVLGDLELTPEQAARAPRVVADRLRDVSMSLN